MRPVVHSSHRPFSFFKRALDSASDASGSADVKSAQRRERRGPNREKPRAGLACGDIWNAWVDFDGSTSILEVRLSRSVVRPAAPLVAASILLSSILGTTDAFVGFTSGTGGSHANHDVLRWTLENDFRPITTGSVPEPGAAALFGLAVAGLALARRRG